MADKNYCFHEFHSTKNNVLEISVFDTGPNGHNVVTVDVKTNPGDPGNGYMNAHFQFDPADARWLAETIMDTLVKRELDRE